MQQSTEKSGSPGKFDLIVIGAGSGLNIASAAAANGMKVALIEEGPLGGTCLNRGCIPTKILIHAADVMQQIKTASTFGIKVSGKVSVDFKKIMARGRVVDRDAAEIEVNVLKAKNLSLFKGRGQFVGAKTVNVRVSAVGERSGGTQDIRQITADKIVIAAGTRPAVPPIEGLDKVPYMTSDDALRLTKLPKHLVIIGGGYIACELAHFFGSLGSKITILQRNVRLLPDEDEEISEKFAGLFSKKYAIHRGFAVKKVEKKGKKIRVYSGGTGADTYNRFFEGTDLLIATGRVPNSDLLQVENCGVRVNKFGYIETNEFMETNVPGIWAIGDIAGKYLFKHSANLEANYVTSYLLNSVHGAGQNQSQNSEPKTNLSPVDYTAMPHAVFSDPQVAGVGATEQELKASGADYLVGRYSYAGTGMGEAMAETNGFVKFLTDYDGKILGCHILGPEAATLLHEVLVSMKFGNSSVSDIANTIHIHPALNEVVQRAAMQ